MCVQDYPMLLGNLVAILFSAAIVITVSLIKPDNYDWKSTREIAMVDDAETGTPHTSLKAIFKEGSWWIHVRLVTQSTPGLPRLLGLESV